MESQPRRSALIDEGWCFGCKRTVFWLRQFDEAGRPTELWTCQGQRTKNEGGCGMPKRVVGKR